MDAGGTTLKTCFVIAPIGDDESETRKRSDKVLKHIVRRVAKERGYEAVRADEISKPGLITTQVIERIANDDLVIADLSEWNPNVFYELALRHALRKPLVQIIAKGERIPFDVAAMRTIEVDVTDLDSVENAKAELDRQIESLERDPDSLQTPLSFTLDVQALTKSGDPEQRSLAEMAAAMTELGANIHQFTRNAHDIDKLTARAIKTQGEAIQEQRHLSAQILNALRGVTTLIERYGPTSANAETPPTKRPYTPRRARKKPREDGDAPAI